MNARNVISFVASFMMLGITSQAALAQTYPPGYPFGSNGTEDHNDGFDGEPGNYENSGVASGGGGGDAYDEEGSGGGGKGGAGASILAENSLTMAGHGGRVVTAAQKVASVEWAARVGTRMRSQVGPCFPETVGMVEQAATE